MRFSVVVLLLFAAGCNKQLEEYAKEAVLKPLTPVLASPNLTFQDGQTQIKMSPGHLRGASTNLSISANITATSTGMSSATKSAQISIQRSRIQ